MKTISILGCGWLGKPLGTGLIRQGYRVNGSTTSGERLAELAAAGIHAHRLNFSPEIAGEPGSFFDCDVLIISVPPRTRQQTGALYLRQLRNIFAAVQSGSVRKIIFISSTAAYPDNNKTVNESDSDNESLLVLAENIFFGMEGLQVVVIRFGGLVGPGRHPGRFLSGKVTGGRHNPVNMIHQTDCIGIVSAIIRLDSWNFILNACADLHPTREQFYTQACRDLGIPLPEFSDEPSPYKIVSSEKLKQLLNYEFRFPDPMKMTY